MGGPAVTVDGATWRTCPTSTNCGMQVFGGSAAATYSGTATGAVSPATSALFNSGWEATAGTGSGRAFGFDIPVPNGPYTVRLHFAEMTSAARAFSIDVENQRVATNLDVRTDAGGTGRALVREFQATVSGGELDLDFIRGTGTPFVQAIEILPR